MTFTPRKILLIKLRHHGDVLLATPVAHALRRHFPAAQIDLLIYAETAPMVIDNPDITRVWQLDRKLPGGRKLWHQLGLFLQLKRQRFDTVIHLSDQWNGAFIARWCASRNAIGFDYPKRKETRWRRFFTALAPVAPSNTLHTVEQNLLALDCLGLRLDAEDKRPVFNITPATTEKTHALLQAQGISGDYVLIHPASRWFYKCWEDDRFADLIKHIVNRGYPVVLTSGPDANEISLVNSVINHLSPSERIGVHSFAGQLSLNALASLINDCRLFVGVDSVPMHMAACLNRDLVALFGPSKINEWRPWNCRHVLVDASAYGELIDPDQIDTNTSQRYLGAIPVDVVISAVDRMLSGDAR